MRDRLIPKFFLLPLIFGFAVLWAVGAQAQAVRFVQITDPHVFDLDNEGTENKAALTACIKKLNERMDENADYKFAVITGDIGIENLVSHVDEKTGKRVLDDQDKRERQLEEGATQLASILASSKIRVWLILPGNNDLFIEQPDTQYYRLFIEKLRRRLPGLEVKDLCADGLGEDKYEIGNLAFIGFNNASFKNDNVPKRIAENKEEQLKYVQRVAKQLDSVTNAFIFYHIPETDDPHIVLNFDTSTLEKRAGNGSTAYPSSSWFVDKDVHDEWQRKVVASSKVRGLFAGHYHDWRRDTYLDYHWMNTANYLSGSLSKLYICPPLAIKRQDTTPSQARGFQEVTIDGMIRIVRTIFWLNASDRAFDTEPPSQNNPLALALSYESARDWPAAETYFGEAAKNAPSTSVRNAALAGLARVKDAQHPWVKVAFAWSDPLFLGQLILRPAFILFMGVALWIMFVAIQENFHAMVIHPFTGDEKLAESLAVGFPAVRAKVTKVLSAPNSIFLPQNVQTAFPFVSPRLKDLFPGQFEFAGVTVPDLNVVLKWLVRPRFEVHGGFFQAGEATFVYAEVWRRKTWFGVRLATVVTREIPAGSRRSKELENFVYDVYSKVNAIVTVQNPGA